MPRYLYLDYGSHAQYRRELKYSLISLRQQAPAAAVTVYTDAPSVYARWPVAVVDIGPQVKRWSGGGLYHHRIKPAAVLDALERLGEPVCLLDSDSIVQPGFDAEVNAKMAPKEVFASVKSAVVMNRFELMNPFPPLKGFRTVLPHAGAYRYDMQQSWMFNSGLIGVSPQHGPLLEDALGMIDALIGRAKKFRTLEQFALSEACRVSQTPIAEVKDSFLHYWQGRRRIYMGHRIARALSADWNDLTPPRHWDNMNYWAVRGYNYWHGVRHMFAGWRA